MREIILALHTVHIEKKKKLYIKETYYKTVKIYKLPSSNSVTS